MALGQPVKLRLSLEKHYQYEDEAARRAKPLSTYLRERLEAEDDLQQELASMRHQLAALAHHIDDAFSDAAVPARSDDTKPLLLETLLLLRTLTPPHKLSMVHGELKRLRLSAWSSTEDI